MHIYIFYFYLLLRCCFLYCFFFFGGVLFLVFFFFFISTHSDSALLFVLPVELFGGVEGWLREPLLCCFWSRLLLLYLLLLWLLSISQTFICLAVRNCALLSFAFFFPLPFDSIWLFFLLH